MGFDVNGSTFADAKVVGISGQPGVGFFRLVVDVEFAVRARTEPAAIIDLGGELKVQANNGQHHVGRLVPQYPPIQIEARREAWSERASLVVELDRRRLEGIEDLRLGGDITFSVSLNGRI